MARPVLASILHDLRRIFEAAGDRQQTDRQLLERFLAAKDEAAFAMLVRRHGRLVLSACRRVLSDEADVEDAFQATFLVLLRKASAVRWQASIGNWLFGVAHRIAVQARAYAARRRRREDEAGRARPEAYSPPDLSWSEAVGLLHEELDRLPDAYRLPLLLCCLDGKTREEAAQVLGCSAGSIKGRLERGRELLRARLLRRGLTLSGTLLAALVDAPPATTASPALVQATLQAARTGVYSRSVAALIRGATSALFANKVRIAAGLLLTVSLLAVGGNHALAPAPEKLAARPAQQTAKPTPEKIVVVRGCVLDPDGKPVKDARLYSPHERSMQPQSNEDREFQLRGRTDVNGLFRVELPNSDLRPDLNPSLLAIADGFGMDWISLPKGDPPGELTLRLVKDQPIEGRILNTEGKPVVGARVSVIGLSASPKGRLDDYLTAWKQDWRQADRQTPKGVYLGGKVLTPARADKDGRFRIKGIGCERVAALQMKGPGIADAKLHIIGRSGFDAAPLNRAALDQTLRFPSHPPLLYAPTFDFVASATRVIEGTVREAGSGMPITGVKVFGSAGYANSSETVSDTEGRFRLVGLRKVKEYRLTAVPDKRAPYLRSWVRARNAEIGSQPLRVDFMMARGVVVTGRVIDKTTGKGVRSNLCFVPLPGNPFCDKPGYDAYRYEQQVGSASEPDGRFRIVVVPGPGVLMAQVQPGEKTKAGQVINPYKQAEFNAEDRKRIKVSVHEDFGRIFTVAGGLISQLSLRNTVKRLDLPADSDEVKCDLFLDRGRTLTIKIQDAEGKPLAGATVAGVCDSPMAFPIQDADCTLFALDPKRPRWVVILHSERKLAGVLRVRGDEQGPLVARLVPAGTLTGRLLDLDNQPIAGADISLIFKDDTARQLYSQLDEHRPPIRTGKDGRFRQEALVPGLKFELGFRQGGTFLIDEPDIGLKQVKPGETLDLGDIRVKPRR